MARLDAWAASKGMPFGDALAHAREAGVTGKALGGIASFIELMGELRALLNGDEEKGVQPAGPAQLLQGVLDGTGYIDELRAEDATRVEIEGRVENVEELLGAAMEVATLADFLTEVSLVSDSDEVGLDDSSVTLMTLHTAKGLEYPVVLIARVE
jgi:DNA helicase-2/ATP-dependent DNA helicase PcrA